ncbi:ubiquitin-like domain-containing protein, partial [Haematococcus lacustris]
MRINIRTMVAELGTLTGIDVEPETTVVELKAILETRAGVPPARQRLIFRGHACNDRQTMRQIGIGDGDAMHLVIRPEDAPASQD